MDRSREENLVKLAVPQSSVEVCFPEISVTTNGEVSVVCICSLVSHVKETLEATQKSDKDFCIFLIGNIKCQQHPAHTILIQFMAQCCYPYHLLPWELPEQ